MPSSPPPPPPSLSLTTLPPQSVVSRRRSVAARSLDRSIDRSIDLDDPAPFSGAIAFYRFFSSLFIRRAVARAARQDNARSKSRKDETPPSSFLAGTGTNSRTRTREIDDCATRSNPRRDATRDAALKRDRR